MHVESFRTPGLGDQTHLLHHDGVAVVVDPQRDVERFLRAADEAGVEVAMVLETHLHNDYVSGGRDLADRTGASLVMPAAAAPAYDHVAAYHLEDIEVPGAGFALRPIHTPGHTPEHTSYAVVVGGRVVSVFSGGSLLVASAGRPDLLGMERARSLGRLQHRSVRRLAELGDDVELFPTHGEGSFCTVSGASRHSSTIGRERTENPVLRTGTAEETADLLLASPMPIPAFYRFMGPSNTFGVPPMGSTDVPTMRWANLRSLPDDTVVIDVRPRKAQADGFLTGSLTIELADDFGSWAAWLAPHDAPVVLVADGDDEVREAVTQLAQVGVDDVRGVVRDLTDAPLSTFGLESVADVREALDAGEQVLDVRMPSEHEDTPLEGAVQRFLPELLSEGVPAQLRTGRPVHVVCGSGRRASIAASLLDAQGYDAVVLDGAGAADVAAG